MITGFSCLGRPSSAAQFFASIAMVTAATIGTGNTAQAAEKQSYLTRQPADEVIYFMLPDRFENGDPRNDTGGIAGGRLEHGYDATHKGFYHGGDLTGLISRLDYIEGMGATAIWLGPIYKNKPVQGAPGEESAGYHGYWITDFLSVDPHLGTNAELKAFVDAAHDRDIKVYLDIITNHTADVIAYRECHDPDYKGADKIDGPCGYRSKADYPYTKRKGPDGEDINSGFMGDQPPFQTDENFAKLKRPDFAYTPFVSESEKTAKNPAWLNDPIYYHNRGDTHWEGESSTYGDFAGLDDLNTEHPRVLSGMIDIFKSWISTYKVDGFRIDTARHVHPEFWTAFNAAMIDQAKKEGIPNFYIFGEAYHLDPAPLAWHTRAGGFPYVLDFGFQNAITQVIARGKPATDLDKFFQIDALYREGEKTALQLPVFVGNHDMGRFSTLVKEANPNISPEELLARVKVAHATMFFLRGAPVIYYGDEQGFVGDGNDQAAREDMFPSQVDSYNDNDLIGTGATTAVSNFDQTHPLYLALKDMSAAFKANAPLRRGAQITRLADDKSGLFAISRIDTDAGGKDNGEYLVIFNLNDTAIETQVETDARSFTWTSIIGSCAAQNNATTSFNVSLGPWDYAVCRSNAWDGD